MVCLFFAFLGCWPVLVVEFLASVFSDAVLHAVVEVFPDGFVDVGSVSEDSLAGADCEYSFAALVCVWVEVDGSVSVE